MTSLRGPADKAQEVLVRWADMELDGHLDKKETALDASFFHEVFGDALGYKTATQSAERILKLRR